MRRVLIANRGEIAKRLIRYFREQDVETVAVASISDVHQSWNDEADYPMTLNGKTVAETYLHPQRIVSAAVDAGCDTIHPGYCFLAERPDFFNLASLANVEVIGADFDALMRVVDRYEVRRIAKALGIPVIPCSNPLAEEDDGIAAGANVGLPLFVKAVGGGALRRVEAFPELPAAVAAVRAEARELTGSPAVYLERAVERIRHVGCPVVADRHGACFALGPVDGSMQVAYRTWVEETGSEVVNAAMHQQLTEASAALTKALGWVGVGRVRWALTPNQGWYLLGFSGRLTLGYSLLEQVYGIDLVHTQLRVLAGEHLGWEAGDTLAPKFGIQLRVMHVDPVDGVSRPEGVLENLELPEDVFAVAGTDEDMTCNKDTEPLLVNIVATAPTRQAAIVRARSALETLTLEGVKTNRQVLLSVLGDPDYWREGGDVETLPNFLLGNRH